MFRWPITHVAQHHALMMRHFGVSEEKSVPAAVWAPTITPTVNTYQQQHSLPAALFRLSHFFVQLNAESRLKLNVWLDAMFEEGVL